MRILLISRFNVPNLGDLIISNTLYSFISQYGKTDKYNLFGDPYKFVDLNNIESKGYSFKYKLFRILNKYHLDKGIIFYKKIKKIFNGNVIQNKQYEDIIDSYDLIIIGGGNMLMSITDKNSTIKLFNNYVDLALQKGKKVFAMDIGIGPFNNNSDKDLAINALNKCNTITFRDNSSYELFINNGGNNNIAHVSVDPVFLANFNQSKKNISDEKIRVGVNVIDSRLIGYNEKAYKKKIRGYVEIINRLNERNIEVLLFITSKEDQDALDDTFKLIKDKTKVKRVKIDGLDHLVSLYNSINLLLGTRMHSMIVAYVMGVPLVGLSWQNKVKSFFNIINESESCFEFSNLEKNQSLIYEEINRKINDSKLIIESMKKNLVTIKEKSKISKEIIEKYAKDLR